MTKKLTVSLLLLALLLPFAAPARADAPLRTPHFPLRTLNFALPQWQQLFPPTSPPPRSDVAMTYDARREMAVMFGGYGYPATGGSTTWLDETWEWDSQGQTWAQRFPQHNPPKRDWAAIAYDHARGVSVMFGGFNAGGTLGDTWLWDGDDWTQVFPQHTPLPRRLQSMAYDFRRQVTVMYGGWVFGTQSYTWEWDGADWIAQDIAEPDPWRWGTAMIYDPLRGTTVLFGGENGGLVFFGDTWQRAGGGDWVEVARRKHPEHRTQAAFAYSPRLRSSVLFGGIVSPNVLTFDTWVWTGKKWAQLDLNPHPTGGCVVMVYDAVMRGILMYSGCSAPGVLDNKTWFLR